MIYGIFWKIGSGKSTYSLRKKILEKEKNWKIIELDLIGHSVLNESKIKLKINQSGILPEIDWNKKITKLERSIISRFIFEDKMKLSILEGIIQKRINEKLLNDINKVENAENALIVSALPKKMNLFELCEDFIILNCEFNTTWERIKKSKYIIFNF